MQISSKAFDLLVVLLRSAGHLKTREELFEALWPNTIVEDTNLAWNMNGLRKALGDDGPPHCYVETVRGHGYRFIAPVETGEIKEAAQNQPTEDTDESGPEEPTGQAEEKAARALPRRRTGAFMLILATVVAVVAGLLAWHFAARPITAKGNGTPTGTSGVQAVPARSVAVLPFENLSPDAANTYFASGIQDMILTKLAGIGDLKVISRTSTQQYPSHPQNLKMVARQLGVATILEGSVQKSGKQVLINVQLIDAGTDNHIWAQAYIRSLDNVFNVESDVAEQVAAALKATLLPAEAARIAHPPTKNPQAYDLFLRAEYLATRVEAESVKNPADAAYQAVKLYRQAIARDPNFTLAYARLSYLESYMYWYNFDHAPARIASAGKAAQQALALNPTLPQAHLAMGFVHYWGHRDYAKALAQFEQAGRDLPNNADVVLAIAAIQRRQGKWQAAVDGFERAAVLDPRNPRWPEELGNTLTNLRHYTKAGTAYDQALAIEPHDYNAAAYKAIALLLAGNLTEARKTLTTIPVDINLRGLVPATKFELAWLARKPKNALASLSGAPTWVQAPLMIGQIPTDLFRGAAWALQNNTDQAQQAYQEARRLLEEASHQQPDNPNLWSSLGLVNAGLGRKAEAISAGSRATQLLPVSKDALYGPSHLASLAATYAQLGEADSAVKLLRRLLSMPAGWVVSLPLLRLDPTWDPIRKDPRFQALLKRYRTAPVTVLSANAGTRGNI